MGIGEGNLQDSLGKIDLLPERPSEHGRLLVLFLATFPIEAVCEFPHYIPPCPQASSAVLHSRVRSQHHV